MSTPSSISCEVVDLSSSSSCEIVDLGLAATCDDATSQLFFSGGGGGGDLSWPAAAEISSALKKQKKVVKLCDNHGVPREFKPVCAGALGCAAACETPPQGSNALCVYADALEAGLRFPLHDFYLKLLRHYGLAPSQLVPSAWKYMAAFVLRCKEARVEPLVSVFRYFFSLCAHKRNDKPLGWHHFIPCAGHHRLFSGTLPPRHDWKARFFFLKSPEGMPWKCQVAWGKPRMEDARVVEFTHTAIDKLKEMPRVEFEEILSRHPPPVGALTLLQLHSTPMPMVKPESAAAGAQALTLTSLHQLHVTLEAGARAPSTADAAGEGDDMTWQMRRKRSCLRLGPVSPLMPQSSAISAVPLQQGLGMTPCETSFDGAWGNNSEISPPAGIWASDTLDMYDALVAREAGEARLLQDNQPGAMVAIEPREERLFKDNQPAAQEIAYLQDQLQQAIDREQQANTVNARFMDYLVAARAENRQLKEEHASEVAKLNQEHASEIAKLQEEHHKASTTHAEKAKAEHMAEIAKLQEDHAAEVAKLNQAHDAAISLLMEENTVNIARVQHAAEEMVQDTKKDIALALFPDLDISLL